MFKKLRKRIYNKKTKELLQYVHFDDFAFCLDCEYPMFVVNAIETKNYSFFVPQTEEMFKLAFNNLQDKFFKELDREEVEYRVNVYSQYFNFSNNVVDYCVNHFVDKNEISIKYKKNINNY